MFSKLQYISQGATAEEQIENIQQVLDAGCKWIQLRFKNVGEKELFKVAQQVKNNCSKHQATFIINDSVKVAKNVDADGVHLGLKDMSVAEAKTILGEDKIIGGTANSIEDVLKRVDEKCSYIGLGPFHFTTTKEILSPILGLKGYETIMHELTKREIYIPIYAIGGIQMDDVKGVMNTGVDGVAVSGSITHYPQKKEWIQNFNLLLDGQINYSK
jgi:thiamine-phosphate pyrophosphorylase|tara:strand:+ start:13784 stop:14428 length:645 start_codon:yes stop_codon:yes gene_type:complete